MIHDTKAEMKRDCETALNYKNLWPACAKQEKEIHGCFIYFQFYHAINVTNQKLLITFESTFLASVFCIRDGSSASSSLPSPASVLSGEVSESEEVCVSTTGLVGNSESVSESGVRLEGVEQAGDDSMAFRFSARNQKK